jgi:co-chaperonin GroES (HSP10)
MILPLQDKILCKRLVEKSLSLIELPENYISYEPYKAEVLEVGPGRININVESKSEELPSIHIKGFIRSQVKKGDIVLVKPNTQYEVKLNGEWLYFIRESDVLGVVE